mmetsp:Transcript_71487/g.126270  ORF Transcript_71487/g.126270 Transcript_71487/m.126270 type:complete len:227 (+) Transcript_71487:1034-1714(+)
MARPQPHSNEWQALVRLLLHTPNLGLGGTVAEDLHWSDQRRTMPAAPQLPVHAHRTMSSRAIQRWKGVQAHRSSGHDRAMFIAMRCLNHQYVMCTSAQRLLSRWCSLVSKTCSKLRARQEVLVVSLEVSCKLAPCRWLPLERLLVGEHQHHPLQPLHPRQHCLEPLSVAELRQVTFLEGNLASVALLIACRTYSLHRHFLPVAGRGGLEDWAFETWSLLMRHHEDV